MDLEGGAPRSETLVARIKAILLQPRTEWLKIDAEPATIGDLFRSYAIIVAAIPAVCNFIGALVFGYGWFGFHYRPSVIGALGTAITQYVLALVGVAILGVIIDALAPSFGGTKNQTQGFKVAIYSATASWVAGVFMLIPALSPLGILGLYSFYLLYVGLPILMKTPQDRALGYTVVTIICAIILFIIIGAITGPVAGLFGGGYHPPVGEIASGTVSVPGGGSVDLGKLDAASKQMQAAAQNMEAAAKGEAASGPVIAPASLQALLPATIGSYHRTTLESSGGSAAGIGGSTAEGRYENGASHFDLRVTDMAAAGAFGALASAFKVQASRQTETGYEKTDTVNGQMVTEKWDNSSKDGSYGMMLGNRFMVQAEGTVGSIDELKQAVAAVSLPQLQALAK